MNAADEQKYVRRVISQENAFDLFAETYTEHKRQISFECLYFIEDNFSQLLKHNREGFRKLPEEVLVELFKSDRLSVGDEYMLFLALQDWGTAALAREQPSLTPKSAVHTAALRERLVKLFQHIRFPMMSPQGTFILFLWSISSLPLNRVVDQVWRKSRRPAWLGRSCCTRYYSSSFSMRRWPPDPVTRFGWNRPSGITSCCATAWCRTRNRKPTKELSSRIHD